MVTPDSVKRLLVFLIGMTLYQTTFGQTCLPVSQQTGYTVFGDSLNEDPSQVVRTSDGGFAVIGTTESSGAGQEDFFLVRLDSCGNPLWSRTYGTPGTDEGASLVATLDGGFLLSGMTDFTNGTLEDGLLIKTDSNGNVQWSQRYGGSDFEAFNFVRQLPDSGFLVAAPSNSFGIGLSDVLILRLDVNGNVLWSRAYGSTNATHNLFDLKAMANGDWIFGGTRSVVNQNLEAYLVRIDSAGNQIWSREYNFGIINGANSLLELENGDLLIAGYVSGFAAIPQMTLFRADSAGNVQWGKTYSNGLSDLGATISQVDSTTVWMTGNSSIVSGGQQVVLMELDTAGSLTWAYTLGDSGITSKGPIDEDGIVLNPGGGGSILARTTVVGQGVFDGVLIRVNDIGLANCLQDTALITESPAFVNELPFQLTQNNVTISFVTQNVTVGTPNFQLVSNPCDTPSCAPVPTFRRRYLNDEFESVRDAISGHNGGVVMAGLITDTVLFAAPRGWLMCTDSTFGSVWTRMYTADSTDPVIFNDVILTADTHYVAVAEVYDSLFNVAHILVVKLDTLGNEVWSRRYDFGNETIGRAVKQTPDGGYIVVGYLRQGPTDIDLYLLRLDALGSVVWSRIFGSSGLDYAYDVVVNADSTYSVAATHSNGGAGDWLLFHVSPGGTGLSATVAGLSVGGEQPQKLAIMPDGGWVMAGSLRPQSTQPTQAGVIRFDTAGAVLWARSFGGPTVDQFEDVRVDQQGQVIAAGWAGAGVQQDFATVGLDDGGNVLFTRSYSYGNSDVVADILPSADGGWLFAGHTGANGLMDPFLIKTDCTGDSDCPSVDTVWANEIPTVISGPGLLTVGIGVTETPVTLPSMLINTSDTIVCESFCPIQLAATATDSVVCVGDSITFTNLSTGATLYEWFLNGGLVGLQPTVTIGFANPGTQTVNLVATHPVCTEIFGFTIEVLALPVADAGIDTACFSGSLLLGTPHVPGNTYAWSPGQFLDDSTLAEPTVTLPSNTVGLWYTVLVTDSNGCSGIDSAFVSNDTVNLVQLPYDTVLCGDDSTLLRATVLSGSPPYTWSWATEPGLGVPNDGEVWVTPLTPRSYTVTATNAIGCSASSEFVLDAYENPVAAFDFDLDVTCTEVVVQFVNQSTGAGRYQWQLPDARSNEEEWEYRYPFSTTVPVALIVDTVGVCFDTLTAELEPRRFEDLIANPIPNVFTPNNDGVNDRFDLTTSQGLEACTEFSIFDRWGNLVFKTNGNRARWDGRNFAGRMQNEGIYFYVVTINGLKFQGSVQLLD